MKLAMKELTYSHRLQCLYCGDDRLSCTEPQEGGHDGEIIWLQCVNCNGVLRLICECRGDSGFELWIREIPTVEDAQVAADEVRHGRHR
jgi:hypothetical protein